MKGKLAISLFFFLVILALSINVAYAPDEGDDLNLTSFPSQLADKLSISEFAGGLLASTILMLACILPTAIFSERNLLATAFVGILVLASCIAFGWLDYWFLIIMAMLVALMFAGKMRGYIGGGQD